MTHGLLQTLTDDLDSQQAQIHNLVTGGGPSRFSWLWDHLTERGRFFMQDERLDIVEADVDVWDDKITAAGSWRMSTSQADRLIN